MTSGNLAICLGPTFLRPEGSVDLTAQFGSVELVARVTEMLIDDAQVILGSDTLELFHDLDDEEPSGVVAELNFESEDSFGSHELISNKRRTKIYFVFNYHYYCFFFVFFCFFYPRYLGSLRLYKNYPENNAFWDG